MRSEGVTIIEFTVRVTPSLSEEDIFNNKKALPEYAFPTGLFLLARAIHLLSAPLIFGFKLAVQLQLLVIEADLPSVDEGQ